MSYERKLLICDNSSDANFRIWGKAISDAILARGWAMTADTGQVDWTTVTVPSSTYVYEIWEPQDALQTGASQIFLKVEYGFSSTSPRIRLTIGTGTNGSGTLTGITTTALSANPQGASGNSGSSTFYECFFSGDVDRLNIILWHNGSTSQAGGFSVERTKNSDGSNNSVGVTIVVFSGNSDAWQYTLKFGFSGTAQRTRNGYYCFIPDMKTFGTFLNESWSGIVDNETPVSPLYPVVGHFLNPMTGVAFIHTTAVANGVFFQKELYGDTMTFFASGIFVVTRPDGGQLHKLCVRMD